MNDSTLSFLTNLPRCLSSGRNLLIFVLLLSIVSTGRAQQDENGSSGGGANLQFFKGMIDDPFFFDIPADRIYRDNLVVRADQPLFTGFNVAIEGNEWCTFRPTLPQTFVMPFSPGATSTAAGEQPPNLFPFTSAPVRNGLPLIPEFLMPGSPVAPDGGLAGDVLPPGNTSSSSPDGLTSADVEFPEPVMGSVSDRVIVGDREDDNEEPTTELDERDEEFPEPLMGSVSDDVIGADTVGEEAISETNADADAEELGSNIATAGTFNIFVKAKKTVLESDGTQTEQAVASAPLKIFFPPGALPVDGADKPQDGFDAEPIQGVTDDDGRLALALRLAMDREMVLESLRGASVPIEYEIDVDPIQSFVLEGLTGADIAEMVENLPDELGPYLHQGQVIGNTPFITLTFPETVAPVIDPVLQSLDAMDWLIIEENWCRTKQAPNDPSFVQTATRGRSGSWGQPYDDQWAIKRVGLTADDDSAWNQLGASPESVVVAVIDTGLDWNHLDISWDNIWKNGAEIPNNQLDDDGNGYIDDVIGWDFMRANNLPWDYDGHGTIVSGIISATQNNDVGIAGINPYSKLMVLKALNAFGNTRASYIAESIVYAVDNGARLVNISVGGEKLSRIERAAVNYASENGVLIIAAAGNEGQDLEDYGPAGLEGVLTVAATDLQDARTVFSNWGEQVDIAAPGVDVLSLRARRTDTMLDIPDVEYVRSANYVGDDNRYYRVSGTSFAAPIVTGIASLVLSKQPDLNYEELHRIITQSADDADVPGKDQFTGYGIVNAAAALSLDRNYYIDSLISGATVVQQDGAVLLSVSGTADANDFERAWIEIGAGKEPTEWKRVATEITAAVIDGELGNIPAAEFAGSSDWVLRLITEHGDGSHREAWFLLSLG